MTNIIAANPATHIALPKDTPASALRGTFNRLGDSLGLIILLTVLTLAIFGLRIKGNPDR